MKYTVINRTTGEKWDMDDYLLSWRVFRAQYSTGAEAEIVDNSNGEVFASTDENF